jgi:hypothetical protein
MREIMGIEYADRTKRALVSASKGKIRMSLCLTN